MMPYNTRVVLVAYDDRELVAGELRNLVGERHFGDITFKRRLLVDHFQNALPEWARAQFCRLRTDRDIDALRKTVEQAGENVSLLIVSSRAGFTDYTRLTHLIERLPYAEDDFTDGLYSPLIVFWKDAHALVERWADFTMAPLYNWGAVWQSFQRLQSIILLDLSQSREFLLFTSGSTATRHFNDMEVDDFYYTKSSADKRKMLAEYSYYSLVPESMRPWLVETFGYAEDQDKASYKMLRYYLADVSLQWVHGAFDSLAFSHFIDRLLFFIAQRPQKYVSKPDVKSIASQVFVTKVQERITLFASMEEGKRINQLAASSSPELDISQQLQRYLRLYKSFEPNFVTDNLSVGHGDPCFSNILYDQGHHLLKLIDPKGAVVADELWSHPYYDLCKISHSVLGDYDFINNGLYRLVLSGRNAFSLEIEQGNQTELKVIFLQRLRNAGYSVPVIRLGEASLFLSMLPLHIDHPNKVIAFMLRAKQIMDEVESDVRS